MILDFDFTNMTGLSRDKSGCVRSHSLFSLSNNLESGFLFGTNSAVSWRVPQTLSGHSGPPLESFLKGMLVGEPVQLTTRKSEIEFPVVVTAIQIDLQQFVSQVRVKRLLPIPSLPIVSAGATFFHQRFFRMHGSLGSEFSIGDINCVTLEMGSALGVCSQSFWGILLIRSQLGNDEYDATLAGISIDKDPILSVLNSFVFFEGEIESAESFLILEQ